MSTAPPSTLVRAVGKLLAALAAPLAGLAAVKTIAEALQTSTAAAALLARSIVKPLAATRRRVPRSCGRWRRS